MGKFRLVAGLTTGMKRIVAILVAGLLLSASAETRLIIDCDIGSSTDDLFALELAAKFHREGLVDFAAVMIDRPGADNLAFTKAYLHHHGLDDVAIGTIEGKTEGQLVFVPYATLVHSNATEGVTVPTARSGRVEDAVRLYRRILAASDDRSVDICAIGFFVNLMGLLDSPADDLSPLGGAALVAQKVRKLRIMAGSFDSSLDHPEYNVWGDVKSARRIFSDWPTPIVATPYETGVKVYYPHLEVLADFQAGHPLARAYQVWDPDGSRPKSQLMWDPMTVLGLVDEERQLGFFAGTERGKVQVDEKGFTTFVPTEGGNTVLQTVTAAKALEIRAYMRGLGQGQAKPSTLVVSPIRIVEICAAPAAGQGDEFITLRNISPLAVSLEGVRIVALQPEESVAMSYTVPKDVTLAGNSEVTFRKSTNWPQMSIPDKAVNVIVCAPNGDVIAEAFVDSRWANGAAMGTGRYFLACDDFPLAVTCDSWRIVGPSRKLTVLDCDPGTDDASAMFLLSRLGLFPDLCVATYGNMPQPIVVTNLVLLTSYLGESPEIYHGAMAPSNGKLPSCGDFHGADGFGGNVVELRRRYSPSVAEMAKVRSFDELATRLLAADEVTYIAVGPLATLATTLEREPRVKDRIKRLYIMGGGIKTFNMPHQTEYNFFGDPVAVKKVLSSGLDITLFPLDITRRDALLNGPDIDSLAATGRYPEVIRLMRCNRTSNVKSGQSEDDAVLHDVLPCLYAVRPELFTVRDMCLTVDEWGHVEEAADGIPVKVATKLVPGQFKHLFENAFCDR